MNNKNEDYSSESDSSDDDYCPENAKEELSEEESDDPCDDAEEGNAGQKRAKSTKGKEAKRLKTQDNCENNKNVEDGQTEKISKEEQKKKADSLWADFLNDTGSKPRSKKVENTKMNKSPEPEKAKSKKETVTVTKIFDFAGEQVKVTKEVSADSVEARLSDINSDNSSNSTTSKGSLAEHKVLKTLPKKSGMQSILGQINKKNTISTLEKSKLDWDGYKKKQGIEEEIQDHNKGKNGYLEQQDFLQRTDLRQFEIEKQMRISKRSNR